MYADSPTPSQRASPTRGVLVLVFSNIIACFRLMVAFFLVMVAEGFALAADLSALLEAQVVSFKFFMSPVNFLTRAMRLSLLVASVVLFNTSFCRTDFSLTSAAARL